MNSRKILKISIATLVLFLLFIFALKIVGGFMEKGQDMPEDEEPIMPDSAPALPNLKEILDEMTLKDKVCQMFIVIPDSITGVTPTVKAGELFETAIKDYPVGGLIMMPGNITGKRQITEFNKRAQELSEIPLFITCDEEGGRVARLKSSLKAHSLQPMYTYKDKGTQAAYENAVTLANTLKAYGFNMDLAPVADVWSNPANTVIGDRAYSNDFTVAADLIASAVIGFHSENVICVLKHFPGHGDTSEDSHEGLAYVKKNIDTLRAEEFLPFVSGIAVGADMVMPGHLIIEGYDNFPASLSHEIIQNLLRKELQFSGLVITDALNMQALTDNFSSAQIAVRAVNAGADILLSPADVKNSVEAVITAVEKGEIPQSRIDESVLRILRLKLKYGILSKPTT